MPGVGATSGSSTGPPADFRSALRPLVQGTRFGDIRWFDTIDSTNRYLLEAARSGADEGVVAVADHQSAGRGRLGRSWIAPRGASLLMSVLFRPGDAYPPTALHLLTVAVALAAADACAEVAGVQPDLKWPNDLIIGDRKAGGILAEAASEPGSAHVDTVVVGLGLNLNWPEDLPTEIAQTATALNHAAGHDVDRVAIAGELLGGLERRYAAVLSGDDGRRQQASEYRRRCATVGVAVRVDLADESFTGTASDISDEGHLLVDVGMCLRTVTAGDVVHLRHRERA